jgi:hypothetical protein
LFDNIAAVERARAIFNRFVVGGPSIRERNSKERVYNVPRRSDESVAQVMILLKKILVAQDVLVEISLEKQHSRSDKDTNNELKKCGTKLRGKSEKQPIDLAS